MHYAAKGEQWSAEWTNNQRFDVVIQYSISPQEEHYIEPFLEYTLQETFTEVYVCGLIRLLKPGGLFCFTGSAADHHNLNTNFAEVDTDREPIQLQGSTLPVWSRQALMKYTSQHFKVAIWSDELRAYNLSTFPTNCDVYFDEETVNSVKTPGKIIDVRVIDFYVQCINVWSHHQAGTPTPRVRLAKRGLMNWTSWMIADQVEGVNLLIQQTDALEQDTIFLSPVYRAEHWNR